MEDPFHDAAVASLLVVTGKVLVERLGGWEGEWYKRFGGGGYAIKVLSVLIGVYVSLLVSPTSLIGRVGGAAAVGAAKAALLWGGLSICIGKEEWDPNRREGIFHAIKRKLDRGKGVDVLTEAFLTCIALLVFLSLQYTKSQHKKVYGAASALVGLLITYSF